MNKPLCVVSCPIDVYSGYSARSRDFLKALIEKKGADWDIKIMSQRWGNLSFGYLTDYEEEWGWLKGYLLSNNQLPRQPEYWFQITVPNEFQPVGKWNCGITAGVETTMCHPSWLEGCNRMNLVLASSNHAKTVLEQTKAEMKDKQGVLVQTVSLKTPVEVLFEGVDLEKYYTIDEKKLPSTELVQSLSSIKEEFCYLFVGHWLPGVLGEDRKNVGLLVKAFLETFKNKKKKPALILKTSGGSPTILDRDTILEKIDTIRKSIVSVDLPRIYLLHGDFSEQDINHLYNHPKVKAMISLTKGEGYGRPLLEFTQSKKPIIASRWSGHLDFLDPEFTFLVPGTLKNVHPSAAVKDLLLEEASWFAPDLLQTTALMSEVYNNYSKHVHLGKRQGHKAKTEFSTGVMAELLEQQLNKHAPVLDSPAIPKLMNLKLPKLVKKEK